MDENIEVIQFAINEIEKRIGHLKYPLCGNTHKEEFFIDERFYHIPSMAEGDYVGGNKEASVHNESMNVDQSPLTGISPIVSVKSSAAKYYDLSGRQLSKPQKGVNIIGGKKIVVK